MKAILNRFNRWRYGELSIIRLGSEGVNDELVEKLLINWSDASKLGVLSRLRWDFINTVKHISHKRDDGSIASTWLGRRYWMQKVLSEQDTVTVVLPHSKQRWGFLLGEYFPSQIEDDAYAPLDIEILNYSYRISIYVDYQQTTGLHLFYTPVSEQWTVILSRPDEAMVSGLLKTLDSYPQFQVDRVITSKKQPQPSRVALEAYSNAR